MYRNKRTKALSRLKTMAPVLFRRVLLLLGDEVCENWRPLCGSFGHPRDDPDKMYNWYELAVRLDDSILESLQFYHRCLIFLPKSSWVRWSVSIVCFSRNADASTMSATVVASYMVSWRTLMMGDVEGHESSVVRQFA